MNISQTIYKLQRAINSKGGNILLNTSQFYSQDAQRAISKFILKKATYDYEKDRTDSVEIFSSYSKIHIALFMRDYWYEMNGWELPDDNEDYLAYKKKYYEERT